MTLADLFSDSFLPTPDTVKTWKQRGVDLAATPFPADAIKSKLEFLRKHVADYTATKKLDLSTAIVSISREKIGDYGIGELLVLSTGHRLAAAACAFHVLEAPAEKPVAEAAAPIKKPKAKAKKAPAADKPAAPKSADNFRGIIDYSPAEVDDAIASFLGNDL